MKRVRYTLKQILDFFERENIKLVDKIDGNSIISNSWLEKMDKEYKIK